MLKKISAQNAIYQRLLKKVLSTLKFSLNSVGKNEKSKFINAAYADTSGITQTFLVCSAEK